MNDSQILISELDEALGKMARDEVNYGDQMTKMSFRVVKAIAKRYPGVDEAALFPMAEGAVSRAVAAAVEPVLVKAKKGTQMTTGALGQFLTIPGVADRLVDTVVDSFHRSYELGKRMHEERQMGIHRDKQPPAGFSTGGPVEPL